MFEMNVVPMATWDFEGDFLNVNQALLDMLGFSGEDFSRISWKEITPEEYRSLDAKCIEELRSQPIATVYEKEYVVKDGSRVKVRLHNACPDQGISKKGVVIIVPI